jgi:hypothetical protein
MENWFHLFTVLGYKTPVYLDWAVFILSLGDRALFSIWVESGKVDSLSILWFKIYGYG